MSPINDRIIIGDDGKPIFLGPGNDWNPLDQSTEEEPQQEHKADDVGSGADQVEVEIDVKHATTVAPEVASDSSTFSQGLLVELAGIVHRLRFGGVCSDDCRSHDIEDLEIARRFASSVQWAGHETDPPSLSADAGASYQRAVSEPMVPTSDNEGRIEDIVAPKTVSGISLFHHLIFPDDYGWPTDEQLAAAIRKIEDEMPPTSDLRINRDGVYMSLAVAIWFLIVVELALLIAIFR